MPRKRKPAASTEAAIAIQQSEARLRLMIDAVPAMITYLDTQERYLFCNQPYMDMLGLAGDRLLGRSLKEVLGAELHTRLQPHREQVLSGERAHYERQHIRPDGSVRDLSVTFVPHWDEQGRVQGFFSLTLDITERKQLERKLAHTAQHDALTGLPNRALYQDRLQQAIERYKRSKTQFALLYLDIDHFKTINDTRGHAVGDRLLKEFSVRIRQCLRASDTAARLGGDEFALILEGPISQDAAMAVAQKIITAMQPPFDLDGSPLQVTASVGVATAAGATLSGVELEALADAALYDAKAKGKNAFAVRSR